MIKICHRFAWFTRFIIILIYCKVGLCAAPKSIHCLKDAILTPPLRVSHLIRCPSKRQVGEASLRNKLSEPWAFWSRCLKPHCNLNIHIVTVAHALFVPQSALSIYTALPFLCPLPRHQLSFPVCSCVFPVWLSAPLVYFGSQLLFPFSFAIWTLFIWTSCISQIKGLTLLFLSALVSAFASSCLTPLQTEIWKKERSVVLI